MNEATAFLRERTDEELVALARNANQDAFTELVVRYRPRIFSVAYRMTLDEEDALDVTQDTVFILCQKLHQLKADAALWGWIRRAAVNQCLSLFRRRQTERDSVKAWGQEAAVWAAPDESVVSIIQRAQQVQRVEAVMHELSPQQRLVFTLRFFEDKTLAEIAEGMGLSIGSVKSHLFRATHRLRERLGVADVKLDEEADSDEPKKGKREAGR